MSETIKHWSKTVNKLVNNINVNANQVVNITTGVESVGHAINADIAQRAGGDPESSTIKDTYSTKAENTELRNYIDNGFVKVSEAQTIAGVKTFSSNPIIATSDNASITFKTTDRAISSIVNAEESCGVDIEDKDGNQIGQFAIHIPGGKKNTISSQMYASNGNATGAITLEINDSNLVYATAPSTPAGSTGNRIVTVDYLGSYATTTEVNAKAPSASPTFTGTPTAPTATAGTNTTQIATTAFVKTAIDNKTSVSGNAGTATKLANAMKITLGGDLSGSVSFDGSDDVTLTATVADDSHNHTIANIDNLEDTLLLKAPSASPAFTGTPTAPTATAGTNTTQIATTAFVKTAIDNKTSVDSATKATQDASGNVITTTYATKTEVNAKAPSASPALTGTPTAPTAAAGTNTTQIATTAFVTTALTGIAGKADKLNTARTIDGVSFDGSANITHFGTCSTAADTVDKTVSCTGFVLDNGARITVQFSTTNTANNPTLNVNSTGAIPVYYRGAAIGAGYLGAKRIYEFVYDGTNYELVGDLDVNNKAGQYVTTTNAEYPLMTTYTAGLTANKTDYTRFASGVTLNPSTGTITATKFKGALDGNAATATTASACSGNAATATTASACSGNAATATKLAASKNIALTGDVTGSAGFDGSAAASIATTLANSGVTAGSYGPSAAASPAHSGTFSVPYITVDAKGRVTSASTQTITLPASGNTDTKVKQTVSTTNNTYPLLACATANATATVTGEAIFAAAIKINPSAGSLTATNIYNAVWNDYAEFFPRGEETEAGDFVALSLDSENEVYVRASKHTSKSVGIHSDSFGHLIGGEDAPDGQDFVEYNLPKFIPVGLVGRVRANIVGEIAKGDFVVISDIPGVGRKFDKELDSYIDIIGMACESSDDKDIKRVKVKLGN